ncbi:2-phospho-L-lactate guanylyltransferase [Parasphingorhabdus pacifica]
MTAGVHLLVPIKPLHLAKSRLRAASGDMPARGHAELVTAAALDTVLVARRAAGVRDVVVVTSDAALTTAFTAEGVDVLPDVPADGLNAALRYGAEVLRDRTGTVRVGALQADLPALRAAELDSALRAAGGSRAFCPDRHGTGTTLLLAGSGQPLDPRFGPDSARAHSASGAMPLRGRWESLRCDVDTGSDLRRAAELGLGPRTSARITARITAETPERPGERGCSRSQ